jgi:hypothetical protein
MSHGPSAHKQTMKIRSRWSYVGGGYRVDEGRFILARFEPEYEYDLDVDGHNELLPLS